jgi:hypothetical protein
MAGSRASSVCLQTCCKPRRERTHGLCAEALQAQRGSPSGRTITPEPPHRVMLGQGHRRPRSDIVAGRRAPVSLFDMTGGVKRRREGSPLDDNAACQQQRSSKSLRASP